MSSVCCQVSICCYTGGELFHEWVNLKGPLSCLLGGCWPKVYGARHHGVCHCTCTVCLVCSPLAHLSRDA